MRRIAADSPAPPPATGHPPWQASLSMGFTLDCGVTRMTERTHSGPLRVQKPLYPEGPEICHAIVVHPPGGVVGGDQLAISASVAPSCAALLTTPGAAKWYRANERQSRQTVRLQASAGAALEWLPQETIFFNQADVQLDHSVELEGDARYIGCEVLCFGRTASGEVFDSGAIRQRTSIRRDGKLIWFEQGMLAGDRPAMHSPLGLCGKPVCATLIACGKPLAGAALERIRMAVADVGADPEAFGLSQLKSVLVARYLGDSSETAKQLLARVWQVVRPEMLGRPAAAPRIWNT
jgi:urease accessory protein